MSVQPGEQTNVQLEMQQVGNWKWRYAYVPDLGHVEVSFDGRVLVESHPDDAYDHIPFVADIPRPDWDALVAFVAGEHARLDKEKQA